MGLLGKIDLENTVNINPSMPKLFIYKKKQKKLLRIVV